MSNPFSAWKVRRRLRRTLHWLEPELIGGQWNLHGSMAVLPAGTDGGPDDYQRRLIVSIAGSGEGGLYEGKERLQGGADACCDVLVARGDWTLLMDRDRRWMLRVTDDAKRAERLVRNARWLAQSYPCPAIEPADTRVAGAHAVRESFADGVPIRDAPQPQWGPAFRQLLLACQRHVAHCQGVYDFDAAWEELQGWRLPAWLERALAGHKVGIEQVLRDCPLLDVHGDCHNGNVFVRPDGSVLLIDL
ncbi:MAG: aminoglycoside phosphotransferase family protein [Ectothiorhodospiraceae bacterium]|nr:aminoglycoside phosphotransferase family protein [Ectothiorhodospiraceae bacterium]